MKKTNSLLLASVAILSGVVVAALPVSARTATRPTPPAGGPTPPPTPTNPIPRPSAAGAAQNSGLFVTSTKPAATNAPTGTPPTFKPSTDP